MNSVIKNVTDITKILGRAERVTDKLFDKWIKEKELTRDDFEPGMEVEKDDKWGVVVSKAKQEELDRTCGWKFGSPEKKERIWIEWMSISTIKGMGPILHTPVNKLRIKGVNVKIALKGVK